MTDSNKVVRPQTISGPVEPVGWRRMSYWQIVVLAIVAISAVAAALYWTQAS